MRHRYRLSIEFDGTADEATDYAAALMERAVIVMASGSHITVRCRNVDRIAMFWDCLGWGAVLGVAFAAYGLWCIAEGYWR
jgi:hypothetical protein